jgi:hypothetical protein
MTFTGIAANAFDHDGADMSVSPNLTNVADTGIVTIVFKATDTAVVKPVSHTDLSPYVFTPKVFTSTVGNFVSDNEYSGPLQWRVAGGGEHSGAFDLGKAYTAILTLTAASGYTFEGAGDFTHSGATTPTTVLNADGTVTVTLAFPPDPLPFSGTSGSGNDSVIDYVKLKAGLPYAKLELLSTGAQENTGCADKMTLTKSTSSPANLIIDGGGREIRCTSALITVGTGVTLTLTNIVFDGSGSGGNISFISVNVSGTFIMGEGVVIKNSRRGVNVAGTFIMEGGEIHGNITTTNGGGVNVVNGGSFEKSGGTIYGSDGNGKKNTATSGDGSGHAVYYALTSPGPVKRDLTANSLQGMTTTDTSSGGGWE